MGKKRIGLSLIVGTAVFALPAFGQTPLLNAKLVKAVVPSSGAPDKNLPDLAPGDDVAIACEAIERVADPSDVRVVLTIAAQPGEDSPGYKKILALNEKVTGSAVHLKVPNAPDLENHTVNLSVYVVDSASNNNNDCDGGQYRIVQTPAPAPETHKPGPG
jgi:hypothetical protein